MRLGVVFPHLEISSDPIAIRDFVQAVEALGYDHLVVYDHVLNANAVTRPGWLGYRLPDLFHEPFVLLGYLSGHTRRLEFFIGILVLPQRQTALVAKQSAELDILCRGRLRLGVGVGWNSVEYEALGMDYRTRGARIEEQMEVLRALWTRESVSFTGTWHRIVDAGISPLPIQRPIPIWMGGEADPVLKRVGRLADGWFVGLGNLADPYVRHPADRALRDQIEKMRGYARAAGRNPSDVGIEFEIVAARGGPEDWRRSAARCRELGVTHLNITTMRAGLKTAGAHIEAIQKFRSTVLDEIEEA